MASRAVTPTSMNEVKRVIRAAWQRAKNNGTCSGLESADTIKLYFGKYLTKEQQNR